MSDIDECPECGWEVTHEYSRCLHCGAELEGKEKNDIRTGYLGCLGILVIAAIIGVFVVFSGDGGSSDSGNSEKITSVQDGLQSSSTSKEPSSKVDPVSYKIQRENDLSSPIVIPNTKPMETARKKKIQYFIVLGNSINRKQVEPTVNKVLKEIRREDPEVDEVILELCSTKGVATHGTGDIGQAIWAPKGELGNMTAEIAQNDLRSNYSLSLDIKDDLEEYLEKKRTTTETEKFGLTLKKRKEIYKALVRAGDKGIKVADKRYSIGSSEHSRATERLMKKYKKQVREKYGISKEVADEIDWEGFKNKWPQPEF